jgi:FtsP/CotA-like multicopper oxidase with cupredoxin domain
VFEQSRLAEGAGKSLVNRTLMIVALVMIGLVGLFFALRPGTTTSGTATPADEPQERAYDVAIENGAMSPVEVSVEEGDQVTLRLTSDSPVEVHLHGYDLEEEVLPGEETVLSFEAEISGRFEIEDHETETALGALLVQPR